MVIAASLALGMLALGPLGFESRAIADECPLQATGADFDAACSGLTLEHDLDLSVSPDAAPVQRKPAVDQLPAIAQTTPLDPAPLPFALKSTDTSLSARTSLGTLQSYNTSITSRKIEGAKALAPAALALPKPAAQGKSPVDIWSNVEAVGFDNLGPEAQGSKTMRTSAGVDYSLSSTATAGIAAERAESTSLPGAAAQNQEKLSAYAAFKASRILSIDTRTNLEKSSSAAGTGEAATERRTVVIAPRISQPFALGGGRTVEPYLNVKQEFDVSSAGLGSKESAGAGVTYAKPDAYSVSVSTDVESAGGSEPVTVKGRLQFKVPLK
jgi:hypothetical protein